MRKTVLQIGLLNIMPKAHEYEPQLRDALAIAGDQFAFHPIRLATHQYLSSAGSVAHYRTFDQVLAAVSLDALIVTGAPVEHLTFSEIKYWPELSGIIGHCAAAGVPLMGICFGGLALLECLGVEKQVFEEKRFGLAALVPGDSDRASQFLDGPCHMAVSTWALPRKESLEPLIGGRLRTIARSAEYGPLVLESDDKGMYIVLGHPEYQIQSLRDEWARDKPRNINYTQRFDHSSFDRMAQLLDPPSTHLLSGWVHHWCATRAKLPQTGT